MPADGPSSDATCPSSEELLAFSQGKLAGVTVEIIGRHVDACPSCERLLDGLEVEDDTLAANVRRLVHQGWTPPEPAVARVEARAWVIPLGPAGGVPPTLTDHAPLTEGQGLSVLGPYRLLRELGRGGMGTVYQAIHGRLNKLVAVKLLPAGRAADAAVVARFSREMAALGALAHPNIVSATDAGEADGHPYLVMEYVDGLDLSALLRRTGPFSLPDAAEVIRQAAAGLQYAHEHGRVHRDLKPSNLMLSAAGVVKILDLGLALLYEDRPPGDELSAGGQVMGTADYMAPEQWLDSHTVDIRADIYSLGCTLYKLLAGRAPFSGPGYETAQQKRQAHLEAAVPALAERPDLAPAFLAVLDRLLAKDPGARLATPAEVAEAMRPFTAGCDLPRLVAAARGAPAAAARLTEQAIPSPGTPVLQPSPPGREGAPERHRRRPGWRVVVPAAALIVAASLVLALVSWHQGGQPKEDQPQRPRPGEWINLPSGDPVPLLWPSSRNSHWEWDPPRSELRLITDGDALIRLGEAGADYRFEVTLYQAKWGDAGIFLGYQPDTYDGKPCTRYQLIQLIAPPAGRGADGFTLAWKTVRLFPDGSQTNGDRAFAAIRDLGDGDQRLSVTVEDGVLCGVSWNDFPLMARFLESPGATSPRGPAGTNATGAFGVYSGRDSVYFRNPRVQYKGD